MVRDGRVTVNGVPRRDVLFKADLTKDRVAVDGKPVSATRPAPVYLVAHKPRGQVTTASDPDGRETVMELVAGFTAPGLAPVGRLDRASAGLLLFTNDHDLADRLLDPQSHVAKEYAVKIRGALDDETLRRMRTERVRDGGDEFRPLQVEVVERQPRSVRLKIVLREGKNRQIRRHLAAFGYEVESLVRTTFGPLALGDLAPGQVRPLTDAETNALRAAAGGIEVAPPETPSGPSAGVFDV
jgi:23S rRNA pseudouridine2605 synthase